jgi:hypothetical protein
MAHAKRKPSSGKIATPKNLGKPKDQPDDFVSVARHLGADESKERFEKKLGKIAKAKPQK